ncbi:MAG: ATP-dependent DNA helicase [Candidatus Cloacimonadota bacterium]|nr:MAG: ATP-dependent DNA helicase [Candidatus Cloacimonadota bacterium]
MNIESILKRISLGEDSYTQFKVNLTNLDKLSEELVAFSNSRGGVLFIGVDDKSNIIGLLDDDIRRLNQLIGNVVNTHITPSIYPLVKVEEIEEKKILILEVDEGTNKPYATNKGIYLTKVGSDKRKISPQELRRLFAESKELYADEEVLSRTDISDINTELFYQFVLDNDKDLFEGLKTKSLNLEIILENFNLMTNKHLTLAGNLIFGMLPQKYNPSFYIDCVYFVGSDVSSREFVSKDTIKGTFKSLYKDALRFITSNLKKVQVEKNFNSNSQLEIDEIVLGELIVNALVHRDYYMNAPIRVFMFDDRIEIINPGKLTNFLTIEKIKMGISIQRNPILNSISKNVLPYSGYGSGIKRVLALIPEIKLINDIEKEEFKCIIPRKI